MSSFNKIKIKTVEIEVFECPNCGSFNESAQNESFEVKNGKVVCDDCSTVLTVTA